MGFEVFEEDCCFQGCGFSVVVGLEVLEGFSQGLGEQDCAFR